MNYMHALNEMLRSFLIGETALEDVRLWIVDHTQSLADGDRPTLDLSQQIMAAIYEEWDGVLDDAGVIARFTELLGSPTSATFTASGPEHDWANLATGLTSSSTQSWVITPHLHPVPWSGANPIHTSAEGRVLEPAQH